MKDSIGFSAPPLRSKQSRAQAGRQGMKRVVGSPGTWSGMTRCGCRSASSPPRPSSAWSPASASPSTIHESGVDPAAYVESDPCLSNCLCKPDNFHHVGDSPMVAATAADLQKYRDIYKQPLPDNFVAAITEMVDATGGPGKKTGQQGLGQAQVAVA